MSGSSRPVPEECALIRPVSLLLVTTSYLPIVGGSEIEAQRVCQALIRRGHRVEILCPGGPPMPSPSRFTDDCGIPVRTFGGEAPARIRGHLFALGVAWTLLAEAGRYDLVYFLMPGLQVAVGTLVARLLRKPSIMKFSGSNEVRRLTKSAIGRLQLRFVNRWTEVIMVLNPGMMEEASECGLQASKLFWMPNPVDPGEFSPLSPDARTALRTSLGLSENAQVILFVGRLAPEKELASLVAGFAKIAPLYPHATLVLVGDGPCRPELTALAASLNVSDRIRFAGAVPPSSVHHWVQTADIFSLVSSLEGLPVSLIEGMSAGLPVVVSDIPGNRQLVDPEEEGIVIETRNSASIATAFDRLLGDASARQRMGEASKRRIGDTFSIGKVLSLYETIFSRVLS